MTVSQAIQCLENLRRAVLTVQGQQGPQAVCGADHDVWREAINVLKCSIEPAVTPIEKHDPPADKPA
jgi:hypothetical protein